MTPKLSKCAQFTSCICHGRVARRRKSSTRREPLHRRRTRPRDACWRLSGNDEHCGGLGESKLRSDRVKAAVQRNAEAGRRTGGGSRPFGYKIIRHDLGEGARRRYRIIGEEIEPIEAETIKEAAARVLRGESIRSIAFDFNDRGIKPVGGGRWAGSTLRRCWYRPGSRVYASTTAKWSATRHGPRSSTAPPMID